MKNGKISKLVKVLLCFLLMFNLTACSGNNNENADADIVDVTDETDTADEADKTETADETGTADEADEPEAADSIHLYFVRHGKTILNTLGRVQGWSDSPLTEAGVEVAENAAIGLSDITFDAVYSSDRMRALETAEIILEANQANSSKDIIKMKGLRETNFGKYEGELNEVMWGEAFETLGVAGFDELYELEDPIVKAVDAFAENDETGEAEKHDKLIARLMDAVNTIVEESKAGAYKNVLVTGHGMAIGNILSEISGEAVGELENASVSLVEYTDGSYKVISVGDMSYAEKGEAARADMPEAEESEREEPVIEGEETGEVVVYLTRHGKTAFNTMGRTQGWVDSPLTDAGVEVAENLGKGISDVEFASVYASDMGRAVETAEIVLENNETGQNLSINQVPGLRETYYGKFESGINTEMLEASMEPLGVSSLEELLALDDSIRKIIDTLHELDETGEAEDYETMSTRVFTAFSNICKQAAIDGGGNILVVSHGNAIMAILNSIGVSNVTDIENASVTKIIYTDGTFTAETVNDMSYAEAGAEK